MASEEVASFSPDELTAYITSARAGGAGGYDIWYATRATRSDAFGAAVLLSGINGASNEEGAVVTADGLTLYVATNDPAVAVVGSFDLATATRASTAADFGALSAVADVNFPGEEAFPSISPDGHTIYFQSQGPNGNDNYRIFRATRTTGPFSTPSEVGELSSSANQGNPVIAADGLSIFIASNRTGAVGLGDIWLSTRSTLNDGFGTPVTVSGIDTVDDEWPVWISPDNCRLYFASNRAGVGDYDIWVASR